MKVAFRTDASLQIGTGHVMRCLTLADALRAKGAACEFICRTYPGNLINFIRSRGYTTHILTVDAGLVTREPDTPPADLPHAHWLGTTQRQDAEACTPILAAQHPDWLIVDHYALDACWERILVPYYHKLMVIDDLADRSHICALLLDQTFGREAIDYLPIVPTTCRLLCGSHYALLRPEFAVQRPYSLRRRALPALRELLITMGGVDNNNVTGLVLQALRASPLPADCRITVVMGGTAPWQDEVMNQARNMPWPTRVLIGITDMAQLMADSDLAIGAAGATSWERCCLGLPTIMIVIADNQLKVAKGLECAGAAVLATLEQQSAEQIATSLAALLSKPAQLLNMSNSAASITNGMGTSYVVALLEA